MQSKYVQSKIWYGLLIILIVIITTSCEKEERRPNRCPDCDWLFLPDNMKSYLYSNGDSIVYKFSDELVNTLQVSIDDEPYLRCLFWEDGYGGANITCLAGSYRDRYIISLKNMDPYSTDSYIRSIKLSLQYNSSTLLDERKIYVGLSTAGYDGWLDTLTVTSLQIGDYIINDVYLDTLKEDLPKDVSYYDPSIYHDLIVYYNYEFGILRLEFYDGTYWELEL